MEVSIIIPTYNDANNIGRLLTEITKLNQNQEIEVIVVDGGSRDITVRKAKEHSVTVLVSPKPVPSVQMNYGASKATGKVLYFVPAYASIHPDFFTDIRNSLFNGYEAGCYRLEYNSISPILKINSYFTRFEGLVFRGGDQTLFITKELFDKLGGFNESYSVMEEYDLIKRIRRIARFRIISKNVLVSGKKYESKSWLRFKLAKLAALGMIYSKLSPSITSKTYKLLLGGK